MKLPPPLHKLSRAWTVTACAALFLTVIFAAAFLLPRLLVPETIKGKVSAMAGASLSGRLEWVWLPLPHLILRDGALISEEAELAMPMAEVYPDWWPLLIGKVRAGEIILTRPQIKIKQLPESLAKPPAPELAGLKLFVRDGSLLIEENKQWPQFRNRDFSITALNGSVKNSPDRITFAFRGKPAAGDHLAVSGHYLRKESSFKLDFSCRALNLQKIFHSFAGGKLTPGDAPLNLTGIVTGHGAEDFSGRLSGDSPCLLFSPKDKQVSINCGVLDLTFARKGDDFSLSIKELEMHEPGLKLAGTVSRSSGRKTNSAPVWQIDLNGSELNLDKIRRAVLGLWGDDHIVQRVTEIVQGGAAGKASFKFTGTAAELEYTRNLLISADDIEATILIPEGDLLLEQVKGKMRIEKGLLAVDAEQAAMGNSRGKNGHLILGLPDDDFTFKLDVDLDADLAELPPVLERLVNHPLFQDELAKFTEVSGRAGGHLSIGDNLKDFQVKIEVSDVKGKGHYQPMAFPFVIEGGSLSIAPSMVQWRNVRGSYGPHLLAGSTGQVRWPDDIFLDITQLAAKISAHDLKKEDLSFFEKPTGPLREHLTGADGVIEVKNARISGKAAEPEKWKADIELAVRNLKVDTPFFPEPLMIKQGKARLTEKELTVTDAECLLFGDSFTANAYLSHQDFSSLRGEISFWGTVGPRLGGWVKEKHLIPQAFFPQLPMRFAPLRINLQAEKTMVSGLAQPEGEIFTQQPKSEFAFEFTKDDPLKMSAIIYNGGKKASLSLDVLDRDRETFLFAWQGDLSGKTLDQFLEEKELLRGEISGNFQLYLPSDPGKTAFRGEIKAKNLRWYPGGRRGHFLDIIELNLAGVGRDLKVRALQGALDGREPVALSGLVSRTGDGFAMALDLKAKALSKSTLLEFKEIFRQILEKNGTPAGNRTTGWNLTGTVGFAIDEFASGNGPGAGSALPLIWQPVRGELSLLPDGQMSATISEGRICCLEATGQWFSSPTLGRSRFALTSVCAPLPRFEDVMPCLGYPQDIIEGELALTGHLEGELNNWQEGNLRIESRQGRILRLKLLAKIFSLINVTDLFTLAQGESSAKGFPYSELVFTAHVKDNMLIIDEAVVKGEGLNLFARGTMNLKTFELDVVVMISPFKTLDAIVSKVPLLGRIIGGKTATLVTFPVGVTGKADDPEVTLLPPGAVGESLLDIVKRTLLLPFYIISPLTPENGK